MKYLLGVLLLLVVAAEGTSSAVSLTRQLTRRVFELEHHLADLLMSDRLHHEMHRDETAAAKELEQKLRMMANFQVGDVIEQIYNKYTTKNRVVYPFRVEAIYFAAKSDECSTRLKDEDCGDDDILYTIVRLNDGHRAEQPESFLRRYMPYSQDTVAVCNVGGYGKAQNLVPCFVQEYVPLAKSSSEQEKVLDAEYIYRVRVEGEEGMRNLSVDKLQRRGYAYVGDSAPRQER